MSGLCDQRQSAGARLLYTRTKVLDGAIIDLDAASRAGFDLPVAAPTPHPAPMPEQDLTVWSPRFAWRAIAAWVRTRGRRPVSGMTGSVGTGTDLSR